MNIPCDGFIIKAQDVKTDESAMTGETDSIKKNSFANCIKKRDKFPVKDRAGLGNHKVPSPVLLSGTKIILGEGLFVVIVVGKDSCAGKIKEGLLQDSDEEEVTPL